ncbi:glycoside hydrolase family 5 protein [Aplosporella prunicola CBS 121167]|uniref:Glycoside hydrolase family 5 protein n=1 Tax=Aplosporella prunicola CBS 121167 TaxID=1176127 RepID=A0A6A6BQ76_9PEZI|nr:glycoside hydrolase family 5 protein [Aplosporella prunicola CBS 121167]KAF2146282.1 glycoside hydrolase family 5 protein [Aplosporella prunicola CBS 121167]
MRSFLLSAAALANAAAASPIVTRAANSTTVTCDSGSFNPITAQQFVDALNPGWNLGNSLDATPGETDWGNAAVTEDTFDDIKATGFKSVRLPVTWHYHLTSESPDWTIDPDWLQRVSDVVDMVTERGFYTIVNVHHDSWIWADVSQENANLTMIEEKFYRLWSQIGQKLACKSELVAFEPINEPPGTTAEHGKELNKLNNLFLKAINEAGGFNNKRVVTLPGLGEDSIKTSQWFEAPSGNYSNPWAIQYHYYSPYNYIFSAWGKTSWGSDEEKASLEADIANIRGNFTDIPLVIGEWAASPVATETAARWKYFDFFIKTAAKYNTSTMLWDNGNDFLNRPIHAWRDETAIEILLNQANGTANSLADSTVDDQATEQSTSAYVFHKVGEEVADQTLPFILNGNTVTGIKANDKDLSEGSDYAVNGANITFKQALLSNYFADDEPGLKANLTVSFSAGAALRLQAVQWDTPTLGSNSSKAESGSDLSIPITWKGIAKPATVKALENDGTYLVDDYTQWWGPLMQARMTYSGQWNWDAEHIILTADVVAAVVSAGKTTTFTIEAYPRVPGNAVNYTLTV